MNINELTVSLDHKFTVQQIKELAIKAGLFSDDFNICLATDSYKIWHWNAYLPNTENIYSYLEARTGAKFNKTIFFGLQYILKKYLVGTVVTKEKIDAAEKQIERHLGKGFFNREGWEEILNKYQGKLPIRIKAVAEGTPVDVSNVLMTVECTDNNPKIAWLTNFLESQLLHVWYPITVATLSHEIKILINSYFDMTADNKAGLDFELQDFGFRGVSSYESAQVGGAAHLVNFKGTDTVPAIEFVQKYYNTDDMPGFSVAATEHSIMTARGEQGEWDVLEHILKNTPNGVLSIVIDSYDFERFIITCGTKYKDQILNRNGITVFRPDSGDPVAVSIQCLDLLEKYFGSTRNKKGYKVLNNKVRLLWGDGIDYDGIRSILFAMRNNMYSAENMACFGMGGGLLQKVNRDTQRFAFKSCAQYYDGSWHDVWKKPKDLSKASKRGRLALIKNESGKFETIREEQLNGRKNYLETVFENGEIVKQYTFEQVRDNANQNINNNN